jgi:leucyl aminopeptidase
MKFRFHWGGMAKVEVDLLAVPCFEDPEDISQSIRELDGSLGNLLRSVIQEEGFKGKSDQILSLHTHGKIAPRKVLLLGLGKAAHFDVAVAREAAIRVVRAAAKSRKAAMAAPDPKRLGPRAAVPVPDRLPLLVQALATGAALGAYRFEKYRTRDIERSKLEEMVLCLGKEERAQQEALWRRVRLGEELAEAVAFARDLVNEPAISLTPKALADRARAIARQHHLSCKVLGRPELRRRRMGCLLGVAQGSALEPQLIHLAYEPRQRGGQRIALVGKGLTFDSGGLSIKPAKSMEDMKTDMAGAAAVLGAMKVVGWLRPPFAVHAFVGATENMPGGRAIRPGDVLRSMSGKTVEVLNTDAEGRLVLADVIHYARRHKVDEIIDLATLTGACMVALGRHTAGYFSNHEALAKRYERASRRAGEDCWRLPLSERLAEQLRSNVADLKNIGDSYGGAITAALFLKEFVGDTPWVHVDIAGPAFAEGKFPLGGGTGYGVMTLAEFLMAETQARTSQAGR